MSRFSGALLLAIFSQANHWLYVLRQTVRRETRLPKRTAARCGSD
jgi:hypothetical protein